MLNKQTYLLITGILFSLIAVAHLLRIIYGWEVVFAGQTMSLWPSWVGVIIPGFLAFNSFRLRKENI